MLIKIVRPLPAKSKGQEGGGAKLAVGQKAANGAAAAKTGAAEGLE